MINDTTQCQYELCNRPIQQVPGGHRKRRYCDDNCKQGAYRLRLERAERERKEQAMKERWGDFTPQLQQALEVAMEITSIDFAGTLADAIRHELNKDNLTALNVIDQASYDRKRA